jgi:NAD(P) transhydrogenase subunit alpha
VTERLQKARHFAPGRATSRATARAPIEIRERQEAMQPSGVIDNLFVFVLASFLGLELIRGVSRLLHTPLMSLTNAIASIAIVGSLLIAGRPHESPFITVLGAVAIVCSSINAVGGFLITERILKMFKKRSP